MKGHEYNAKAGTKHRSLLLALVFSRKKKGAPKRT
jgi:hypothetical protein